MIQCFKFTVAVNQGGLFAPDRAASFSGMPFATSTDYQIPCRILYDYIGVTHDGKLTSCCVDYREAFVVGHLELEPSGSVRPLHRLLQAGTDAGGDPVDGHGVLGAALHGCWAQVAESFGQERDEREAGRCCMRPRDPVEPGAGGLTQEQEDGVEVLPDVGRQWHGLGSHEYVTGSEGCIQLPVHLAVSILADYEQSPAATVLAGRTEAILRVQARIRSRDAIARFRPIRRT